MTVGPNLPNPVRGLTRANVRPLRLRLALSLPALSKVEGQGGRSSDASRSVSLPYGHSPCCPSGNGTDLNPYRASLLISPV